MVLNVGDKDEDGAECSPRQETAGERLPSRKQQQQQPRKLPFVVLARLAVSLKRKTSRRWCSGAALLALLGSQLFALSGSRLRQYSSSSPWPGGGRAGRLEQHPHVPRDGGKEGQPASPAPLPSLAYNHTFPRWGGGGKASHDEGIDLGALLRFVEGTRPGSGEAPRRPPPSSYFPHVVHAWGGGGVWLSSAQRRQTSSTQIRHRAAPVEKVLCRAWAHLATRRDDPDARRRWPRLMRTMEGDDAANPTSLPSVGAAGGFPFVMYHGDYRGCNWHNFEKNGSVPIFTTCARVDCHHALPFPNYRTVSDSLPSPEAWDAHMKVQALNFPWKGKIRKLVWRGGLTGQLSNLKSARGRLGAFALEHRDHPLLDIGIHNIPPRHYKKGTNQTVPRDLKSRILMKPPMPPSNFSNYLAVLDTDGNSWSSRFGRLLCLNSVVVKVEPRYVDYFYRDLRPWAHYVPVRYDLSDLLQRVEWVLDPAHDDAVLKMVRAANEWCRSHMTLPAVTLDMLDVLDTYVSYLDRGGPDWPEMWRSYRSKLWEPGSGYEMQLLPFRLPA